METIAFNGLHFAQTLPRAPGVYRYFDGNGRLLYVGKARDLQKRVTSYFQKTPEDPRIATMVAMTEKADFTVTPSEVDALVLESRLIREERPVFNIRLREGSGYPYLHLSTHKPVPQLTIHRGRKGREGRYFGPYPSGDAVRQAHDILQRHFGLRTCSDGFFAHRSRPCLEYQIGRCSAPCVQKIAHEDYRQRVRELEAFLDGHHDALDASLAQKMEEAAGAMDFEGAALWRDRMASLRRVRAKLSVDAGDGTFDTVAMAVEGEVAIACVVTVRRGEVVGTKTHRIVQAGAGTEDELFLQFLAQHYLAFDMALPSEILIPRAIPGMHVLTEALAARRGGKVAVQHGVRGSRKMQLDLAIRNANATLLATLQSEQVMEARRQQVATLLGMDAPPERIECFDISHMQGEATVASCVVFGPRGARKKDYRRFNIRGVPQGDDYLAMRQAVSRRLDSNEPMPDLLLIDGGAGQVKVAAEEVRKRGLAFPVVGVSKGPDRRNGDEVLVVDDGARIIRPGHAAPGLHLIQAVRDEAHRFALSGHQARREKNRTRSRLEDLPGIGPKRRRALLQAFGGMQGLKRANVEEVAAVPGIGPDQALRIVEALGGL